MGDNSQNCKVEGGKLDLDSWVNDGTRDTEKYEYSPCHGRNPLGDPHIPLYPATAMGRIITGG